MVLYKRRNLRIKKFNRRLWLGLQKDETFTFAKYTTYGCGGEAEVAYLPQNTLQAICAYEKAKRERQFCVIGNGSNVLASDCFYHGAVICTKKWKGIFRLSPTEIFCLAGTSVGELLQYCTRMGLSGLEFLTGIPATCGALAFMNGGVKGNTMGEHCKEGVVYSPAGMAKWNHKMCNFAYKHSTMRDINVLILGLKCQVLPKEPNYVKEQINFYADRRKHLPRGKSCGCVFQNPKNCAMSAGELIDKAGLKGTMCGGAVVSEKHANFILNNRNKALDVFWLIKRVKHEVYKKFGILLEEEVVYIGDFYDFNG